MAVMFPCFTERKKTIHNDYDNMTKMNVSKPLATCNNKIQKTPTPNCSTLY